MSVDLTALALCLQHQDDFGAIVDFMNILPCRFSGKDAQGSYTQNAREMLGILQRHSTRFHILRFQTISKTPSICNEYN